jgi:hypothetical protein
MDKTLENTLKTSINIAFPTCQEVGRRKGAKTVVVIWSYSVVLVWLV